VRETKYVTDCARLGELLQPYADCDRRWRHTWTELRAHVYYVNTMDSMNSMNTMQSTKSTYRTTLWPEGETTIPCGQPMAPHGHREGGSPHRRTVDLLSHCSSQECVSEKRMKCTARRRDSVNESKWRRARRVRGHSDHPWPAVREVDASSPID
jgi:hypothetical protein